MFHYKSANEYFQEQFGEKVYKLALDAGFTCPNRDGTLDTRGCIFCAGGSGDFAVPTDGDLFKAIEAAKSVVEGKGKRKFIAYFQSYTCTYAPVNRLRTIFAGAVSHPDIVALSIGTRPDCLPEDVLLLLQELNAIKPVYIELGLQTIHESTARYIRRGYSLPVFDSAVCRLKEAGISVIVHMILGLPEETREMMVQTAEYIGHSGADGIKFQLLHVLNGTDLAADYASGKFAVLSMEDYISILMDCLSVIPPELVVHRLTGDGAKRDLIAPLWSANKKRVLNAIHRELRKRSET